MPVCNAMWRRRYSAMMALACCLLARLALASSATPLTLRELVLRSDATVLGHTVAIRSYWQGPRIVTVAQVAIDELWAGTLAGQNVVDVVTLGGSVGDYGQRVDGAAQFTPYGRMVLHLGRVGQEYAPTGMAQGLYHVDSLWGDAGRVQRQVPATTRGPRPLSLTPFAPVPTDTVGALREAVRFVARNQAEQP